MLQRSTKSIMLFITEDCNFRCRYCYVVHKRERRMPIEVARAAIDYLLVHRELFSEDRCAWSFLGGEPLLEPQLIDEIIGYFRRRSYALDHPWFHDAAFQLTTNGSLYHRPEVQRLIQRHRDVLAVRLTIDGTRRAHDLQRVSVAGGGTYDQVVANVPLWLEQYPDATTKVTLTPETLPLLAESILHLYGLGIRNVEANVIFEDVWRPGDDAVFEEQLDLLGDAMLAEGLWPDHRCSLLDENVGRSLDPADDSNWCGAGALLAVDPSGQLFPCLHFLPATLRRPPRPVGDVWQGVDANLLRPFLSLTRSAQSPDACMSCEVCSGCAWCQAVNYELADTPTLFQRATTFCALHKARGRANRRFWERAASQPRRISQDSRSIVQPPPVRRSQP
jgi:uncharacterized protein